MRNPYQASHPISDPNDFFGRKTECQLLYEMLLSGESVNITGPRRIGKSSLLKVLPTPEMQKNIFGEEVFKQYEAFASVNLQNAAQQTPFQVFSKIGEQLRANGLEINAPDSYANFEAMLKTFTEQKIRLIVLIDEFDAVTQNTEFNETFFNTLRAYQQDFLVSYFIASVKSVKEIADHIKNVSPFFNIFRYLPLSLLTEDATNDLICKDDSLAQFIGFVKLTAGRHPLFISQLCFYLFHFQHFEPFSSDKEMLDTVLHRFLKEAIAHFEYYWEHLSTDERDVLKKLAQGKQPDGNDVADVIELEQKALIVRNNGHAAIFSSAFEGFVKAVEFSETEEKVSQFFEKNKKAFWSIVQYCVDKAIELKN